MKIFIYNFDATRTTLYSLSTVSYHFKHIVLQARSQGAARDLRRRVSAPRQGQRVRFHRVREAVAKDSIDVTRVTGGNDPATSQMVADILTKSTPAPLFAVMASIMSGMRR